MTTTEKSTDLLAEDKGAGMRVARAGLVAASLVLVAACAPIKPPAPEPDVIEAPFEFTGLSQEWEVPAGVAEVTVHALGARGGAGIGQATDGTASVTANGGSGGSGGAATATIAVTPGQLLQVNVGGLGSDGLLTGPAPGGFNGGGEGRAIATTCAGELDTVAGGGGGGGASDVRQGGTGVESRVVVASGGAGGGSPYAHADSLLASPEVTDGADGGDGGGFTGNSGGGTVPGTGGTQSVGGTRGTPNASDGVLGVGGDGALQLSCLQDGYAVARAGGGGGGGLYGGGGGGAQTIPAGFPAENEPGGSGGGGGSGFTPDDTLLLTGVNEGNGRVVIRYVAP